MRRLRVSIDSHEHSGSSTHNPSTELIRVADHPRHLVGTVVNDARAAVVGHDQAVGARDEKERVRCLERRQRFQMLTSLQVEDFHRTVILGGNEQLVLARIGEKVIEVTVIAR